jgi:hypothetical protein
MNDVTFRTGWHQFGVMVLAYVVGLIATFALLVIGRAGGASDQGTFILANIGLRITCGWIGLNLARWKNNGAEVGMTILGAIFGWFAIAGYALFSDKKEKAVEVVVEQIDLYLEPEWKETR